MLVLLAGMNALGQFANGVNLPSFPAIANDLAVDVGAVQISFVYFLVFYAVSQLIFGPLSDRFGRKPLVIIGILIYLVGCVWSAWSVTIDQLIVGRVLQAIGSCAGIVVGRAITRDLYEGKALAEALAVITIIFAAAPGLAPLLGGFLQDSINWQSTFWASLILGIIVLLPTLGMAESRPEDTPRSSMGTILKQYISLFRSAPFVIYTLTTALVSAGMYAIFAGAPVVYIDQFGLSAFQYGFVPAFSVTGFILGGLLVKQLLQRMSAAQATFYGLVILTAGSLLALGCIPMGWLNLYTCTLGIFLYVTGTGIVFALAIAGALDAFPHYAGGASAMVGFLQMMGGALGPLILSVVTCTADYGMLGAMSGMGLLGCLFYGGFKRRLIPTV